MAQMHKMLKVADFGVKLLISQHVPRKGQVALAARIRTYQTPENIVLIQSLATHITMEVTALKGRISHV